MNEEIYELLCGNEQPRAKFGIVVFYKINREDQTLIETGRTSKLSFSQAIDIYSETPNPASQIIEFTTEEEQAKVEAELTKNVNDREWLDQLFQCI